MNVNDLNSTEKEQYKEVASELRCLVCQNQSLADSHASLAVDLKEKIAEQIRAGKTNEEIKSFMQDRYGEFVIYKPAYSMENAVLWLGPFVVLLVAVVLARRVSRGTSASLQPSKPPAAEADPQWAEKLYSSAKPEKKD
ncbi:cytochrome c-type biogenesis protein [Limnobacter parvus]|uniref:Cytochrome c-type biogenesis protein n=1 Tax=Limnobacter parvus TaxID=2939690 RepID=A0ABT1XH02_9BURK|nr:cytochrome c-type biogenesis protein [Limnobacter parvus]MCR2746576.1 cytochrome c-type biogenesis protein CcmH [Limnobacter parvus]